MPCNSAHVTEETRRYIRELTGVLATLDLEQLKEFYGRWAPAMDLPPMPDDHTLEEDLHLMILELPGLSHLHQSSQEWLLGRGLAVTIREQNCVRAGRADTAQDAGAGTCDGCDSAEPL